MIHVDVLEEILWEILSRLHVKDLLRFKSVSKKWNSIISSQYFINLHLKKSISSASRRHLILVRDDTKEGNIKVKQLTRPEEGTEYFLGISSDGIICHINNYNARTRICMLNPATRVSKTVNVNIKINNIISWFGRESSDDVYKVVLGVMVRCIEEEVGEDEQEVLRMQLVALSVDDCNNQDSVYYSTQDINIDEHQLGFDFYEHGTLFNGIVHWLVTRADTVMDLDHTSSSVIFTYNLGRKCVGEIIPTPVKPQKRGQLLGWTIGVIDGCMSAVFEDCRREIYEVWVMKEYGIKESWTKLLNIPEPPGDSIRNLALDGVSDYGDILFRSWTQRDKHNVVIYNVAENKYTKNLVSGGNNYIRMYVETLVSPGLGLKRTTIAAIEG